MMAVIPKEIQADLSRVLDANRAFSSEAIVLAKNENSDLILVSKECSKCFFETLFAFDGPLWRIYSETRTGFKPVNSRHLNFIGGRMYFCKNVEKRFIRSPGPEKNILFKEGLVYATKPSLENAILLISSPFEILSQAIDISLLPVYVDQKLREFPHFRKKSLEECEKNSGDPLKSAEFSMSGAVKAMEFSFVSSLASAFNIRIADSEVWQNCEAERLFSLWSAGKAKEATEEFGFHSESPYDISIPRASENPESLQRFACPAPKNKYARWRENCKFVCSRYLSGMRSAFLNLGKETKLAELVFHLRTSELQGALENQEKWGTIAKQRKMVFYSLLPVSLPSTFVFTGQWQELSEKGTEIHGTPAGAPGDATGPTVFIDEEADYLKSTKGKIIVSRTLSPNLTTLFNSAKGIVSESGGVLSHSAIIARETGLPCIIQTKNINRIKEGRGIVINGKTGWIRTLD